ncbi:MAG: hypothetical protein Q9183_007753 [Haloplaca sp. 2 TL-2023]
MARTTQSQRRGDDHKRMHSASHDEYPEHAKVPKIQHGFTPSDSLEAANARVQDLEQQVHDLHDFINAKGLARLAPDSIRKHMEQQSNGAQTLATQIRNAAEKVYDRLKGQALNARKTGVTSDDISSVMMHFLAEAEELSQLLGGIPLAFDLVMDLARFSLGCVGDGDSHSAGFGDRPSDNEVDRLIIDLATKRKQMEPSWSHVEALETLREQNKRVADYGVDGFCAKSIELLDGWEKPVAQGSEVGNDTASQENPMVESAALTQDALSRLQTLSGTN